MFIIFLCARVALYIIQVLVLKQILCLLHLQMLVAVWKSDLCSCPSVYSLKLLEYSVIWESHFEGEIHPSRTERKFVEKVLGNIWSGQNIVNLKRTLPQKHTAGALPVVNSNDCQIISRERSVFAHTYHMLLSEERTCTCTRHGK